MISRRLTVTLTACATMYLTIAACNAPGKPEKPSGELPPGFLEELQLRSELLRNLPKIPVDQLFIRDASVTNRRVNGHHISSLNVTTSTPVEFINYTIDYELDNELKTITGQTLRIYSDLPELEKGARNAAIELKPCIPAVRSETGEVACGDSVTVRYLQRYNTRDTRSDLIARRNQLQRDLRNYGELGKTAMKQYVAATENCRPPGGTPVPTLVAVRDTMDVFSGVFDGLVVYLLTEAQMDAPAGGGRGGVTPPVTGPPDAPNTPGSADIQPGARTSQEKAKEFLKFSELVLAAQNRTGPVENLFTAGLDVAILNKTIVEECPEAIETVTTMEDVQTNTNRITDELQRIDGEIARREGSGN